jgi:ABC-2 type transport system permease protein
MVDTVKGLMISSDLSNLLIDLVAIAVFDAVMLVLASISFKRIIE